MCIDNLSLYRVIIQCIHFSVFRGVGEGDRGIHILNLLMDKINYFSFFSLEYIFNHSHYLGSVKQMSAYMGLCNCCGLIEIRDTNDDVLYKIEVPCRLCSCSGGLNVDFYITDVQGKDVSKYFLHRIHRQDMRRQLIL